MTWRKAESTTSRLSICLVVGLTCLTPLGCSEDPSTEALTEPLEIEAGLRDLDVSFGGTPSGLVTDRLPVVYLNGTPIGPNDQKIRDLMPDMLDSIKVEKVRDADDGKINTILHLWTGERTTDRRDEP